MELGIDGERMTSFIRSRVLGELLGISQNARAEAPSAVQHSESPAVSEKFDASKTLLKQERAVAGG